MLELHTPESQPESSAVGKLHDLVDDLRANPKRAAALGLVLVGGAALVAGRENIFKFVEGEQPVCEGIADFRSNGKLPGGLYKASWTDFAERFGRTPERQHLLSGLQKVINQLNDAGCREIRVGGSFVSAKVVPGDYDAMWVYHSDMDLSKMDHYLASDFRAGTKYTFGGDVFSSAQQIDLGRVIPKRISPFDWLTRDRIGRSVGVVSLDPATVPRVTNFRGCTYGRPEDLPWL